MKGNDVCYKEENELHKPQQEIPSTKITRKLAVQTTAPPNTKGKVKEGKYCMYGGSDFML